MARPQKPLSVKLSFLRSIEWWERAYIVDWVMVALLYFGTVYIKLKPIFERDFARDDPLISHGYRKEERVSDGVLHLVSFWIPLFISLIIGALKGSSHDMHHGALALCAGMFGTNFITEFLKNRVGRLRPDFLSRCQWDIIIASCSGPEDRVTDGRRSFPSGHSSQSFAGLGFLFLLLGGQLGSLCIASPATSRSFLSSRILRLSITLVPLLGAAWVAVTRLEDYRHHKEDVIVGSLLGFAITYGCYIIYWPNPFRRSASLLDRLSEPKILYRPEAAQTAHGSGFELARMGPEEDLEASPRQETREVESHRPIPGQRSSSDNTRVVTERT